MSIRHECFQRFLIMICGARASVTESSGKTLRARGDKNIKMYIVIVPKRRGNEKKKTEQNFRECRFPTIISSTLATFSLSRGRKKNVREKYIRRIVRTEGRCKVQYTQKNGKRTAPVVHRVVGIFALFEKRSYGTTDKARVNI